MVKALATVYYDPNKIHTIDMMNYEQYKTDLAAGIISRNEDMTRRINGKMEAHWSENFNEMCTEGEDKNYDPTYWDLFCSNFYYCLRVWTTDTCSPYMAIGLTRQ